MVPQLLNIRNRVFVLDTGTATMVDLLEIRHIMDNQRIPITGRMVYPEPDFYPLVQAMKIEDPRPAPRNRHERRARRHR